MCSSDLASGSAVWDHSVFSDSTRYSGDGHREFAGEGHAPPLSDAVSQLAGPPGPGLRTTSDLPLGPSGRPLRADRPQVPLRPRTQVVPCSTPRVGPPGPGRFSLRLRVAQQALRCAPGLLLRRSSCSPPPSSAFGSGRSHRPSATVDAAARPPALSGWWRGRPVLGDIGRLRRPTSVIALRYAPCHLVVWSECG